MTRRPHAAAHVAATILAALALAGCSIRHRPQIRYVGPLVSPTDPTNCPPLRGVLTLRENKVSFTPDESTWVLEGDATPTTLTATKSRPGADHKPYQTTFKATWTETKVQGTFTTPRCTYNADLTAF